MPNTTNPDIGSDFADNFKSARISAGLSQSRLSTETGIPKRTIENWESGANTPPEWTQRLVLAALRKLAVKEG